MTDAERRHRKLEAIPLHERFLLDEVEGVVVNPPRRNDGPVV